MRLIIDIDRLHNKEYNREIRLFKKSHSNCNECEKLLEDKYDKKADHKVPVTIGGEFYGDNLQLLCNFCHQKKTRFDDKFIKFMYSTRIIKSFGGFNETEFHPNEIIAFYFGLKKLYDYSRKAKDTNERIKHSNGNNKWK